MPKNTKDLNKSNIKKVVEIKPKKAANKTSSSTSKTKISKQTVNFKKVASKSIKSKSKSISKPVTKKAPAKVQKKLNMLEYYDLPYRYNQTIVKMLAQSPNTLFVYWDISDIDRNKFIEKYGDNFFSETKPVLVIHNKTKNYTFEIEINDYANCWYFNVKDDKCEYSIELGRKPITTSVIIPNNYLCVTSSNEIESPNGHILFEKEQNSLFFRNVKNNEIYSKNVANLQFINRLTKTYKIYDIYKSLYKEDSLLNIDNPSSTFK